MLEYDHGQNRLISFFFLADFRKSGRLRYKVGNTSLDSMP